LHPIVVQELTRSPAQLALNLREVAHVDVGAVDALAFAARRAAASDISFCLVAAQTSPIADALAAANVRKFFEIFASIQDAWDSPG
jgi:anti-anti-sigma regulatory factor